MNSSNETFYPLDYWLGLYGFPYTADVIFAYVITPIWLLSLVFSIFNLFILLKTQFFASKFFNYMRLYVVNCMILSLVSLTTVLANTRQFFTITNSFEASFYSNYIFFPAQNSLILFSGCIEICLVVERMLYLLPRTFKRIKLIRFRLFFFGLFTLCLAVNILGVFLFEPTFAEIQLDEKTTFRIWYVGLANFYFSLAGQIVNYFEYVLRDVLPMTLNIIINSLSIYTVGKYVRDKQKITAANSHMLNFDRKQTYIALIMSTFSLLEHMLYIGSFVSFFYYYLDLSNLFYACGLLFISIKHFLIFFILLIFNSLFRNEVKNILKFF